VADSFEGLAVYGGLDLSETTDLTALVLTAKIDGVWHVRPTFWLPAEGLRERARKDRVPYDVWAAAGYIETVPGKTVDYDDVAMRLRALFDALDIRCIAFDRWNWRHLRPCLLRAGFDEAAVTPGEPGCRFVEFGQGYASMSPAFRALEADILNGRIRHGGHPVLTMCAANAVVQADPAGNRKLTKARSRGRIDGMVALVMARGVASSGADSAPKAYQMFFV
jgi:phage terminase large subunit-like protein